MTNFVVSIAPGSATTSDGQITYTYILNMDAVASVDEPINYELRGVGANPATNDDLSRNQSLTGTVVFKPGETQKILTVTIPAKPANQLDQTFEVQLTSSLAWVTPDQDKDSVIALVSSTPKSGSIKLIDGQAYFNHTTATPYTPTKINDYVQILGGSKIDTMAGDDRVIAISGGNTINTGDGNDQITIANGLLNSDEGKNIVNAGNGNDRIVVTELNIYAYSNIDGGKGKDILDFSKITWQQADGIRVDLSRGKYSDIYDFIPTEYKNREGKISGIEHVIGSTQSDSLTGSKAIDILDGGPGNDQIRSLDGNDELSGGDGSDELDGGLGGDILTGGEGRDTFVFGSSKDLSKEARKTDTITDFKHGEDKVSLEFDLNTKQNNVQSKIDLIGTDFFTKVAGQVRYTTFTNNSESYIFLQGDNNGDGQADWGIKLVGLNSIDLSDFSYANSGVY